MRKANRLNIGCGSHIMEGWVNLDISKLPGVDVVHDLSHFPWPFRDGYFTEVYMKDVLEHLPDTIKTMEEIYRITIPGANVFIGVPYWNSYESVTDPSHVKQFNEFTFEFFDPSKRRCQKRHYYSTARFRILKQGYWISLFAPYLYIPLLSRPLVIYNVYVKKILSTLAAHFSNIIIAIDIYLERSE
jgi:hypothetical protein